MRPLAEQAGKGYVTTLDWVWLGGYTRSPAAVTGWHWAGGITPALTTPTSAWVVAPFARVTVCGLLLYRAAALPIWVPLSVTPKTPGYPNRWHDLPDRLVNSRK